MKPVAKIALLGCTAVLITTISIWWSGYSSDESATELPIIPSALQWRVGTSQQYDVRVDSTMQMSDAEDIRVLMSGILDMQTLEVNAETALVGLRLSSAELDISHQTVAETNRALSTPFRVRFLASGMPDSFEFAATVSAENRLILENLVRTFQVSMQGEENWSVQEANASGTYEALYQRTSPSLIEKSKGSFAGHPSATIYQGAEVASNETIRTDVERDWLAAMTVNETVRTRGVGGPALEINNQATLELMPSVQISAGTETWDFVAAVEPAAPAEKVPELSPEEARQQIIANVSSLNESVQGRSAEIHRLRDLLRVDEAMPSVLLDLLQAEDLTDRTRADLYLAFELAGTDQAQVALASVISNPAWSQRDSMRAIVALAGVKSPSPDTIAALWAATMYASSSRDDVQMASASTYALGSIGKAMKAAGHPEYSSLSAGLLNGAIGGVDEKQRAAFVHAIGNTRDASMAPDIVMHLDDAAPEVRRAAALSLGVLDANHAAGELLSRFNKEPSSQVRGAMAEAMVNWTEPTDKSMDMFRSGVRAESDENTRYNMARFLSKNLAEFPENRSALQELLRTEQSKRIRQSVAEALYKSAK